VFDYGFDEIARIVGKTEENSRQISVRARKHVHDACRGSRAHARGSKSSRGEVPLCALRRATLCLDQ
jgi:hypothetical protein